jgi:hypothetical protein
MAFPLLGRALQPLRRSAVRAIPVCAAAIPAWQNNVPPPRPPKSVPPPSPWAWKLALPLATASTLDLTHCSDDEGRASPPPFNGLLFCQIAGVRCPPLQFQPIIVTPSVTEMATPLPAAVKAASKKRGPKAKNLQCKKCTFAEMPCIGSHGQKYPMAPPLSRLLPVMPSPLPTKAVKGSLERQRKAARIIPDYKYLDRYLDNERAEFGYNQGNRNGPLQLNKWRGHNPPPPPLPLPPCASAPAPRPTLLLVITCASFLSQSHAGEIFTHRRTSNAFENTWSLPLASGEASGCPRA